MTARHRIAGRVWNAGVLAGWAWEKRLEFRRDVGDVRWYIEYVGYPMHPAGFEMVVVDVCVFSEALEEGFGNVGVRRDGRVSRSSVWRGCGRSRRRGIITEGLRRSERVDRRDGRGRFRRG